MNTIAWLVTLLLLALQPQFVFRHDRRNYDGERVTALCGGLYQRTETWVCLEVPHG